MSPLQSLFSCTGSPSAQANASQSWAYFILPEWDNERQLGCEVTVDGEDSEPVEVDPSSDPSRCSACPMGEVLLKVPKSATNDSEVICESGNGFQSGGGCELKEAILSFTPGMFLTSLTSASAEIVSAAIDLVRTESLYSSSGSAYRSGIADRHTSHGGECVDGESDAGECVSGDCGDAGEGEGTSEENCDGDGGGGRGGGGGGGGGSGATCTSLG